MSSYYMDINQYNNIKQVNIQIITCNQKKSPTK